MSKRDINSLNYIMSKMNTKANDSELCAQVKVLSNTIIVNDIVQKLRDVLHMTSAEILLFRERLSTAVPLYEAMKDILMNDTSMTTKMRTNLKRLGYDRIPLYLKLGGIHYKDFKNSLPELVKTKLQEVLDDMDHESDIYLTEIKQNCKVNGIDPKHINKSFVDVCCLEGKSVKDYIISKNDFIALLEQKVSDLQAEFGLKPIRKERPNILDTLHETTQGIDGVTSYSFTLSDLINWAVKLDNVYTRLKAKIDEFETNKKRQRSNINEITQMMGSVQTGQTNTKRGRANMNTGS
jgi:hypothetical protein